MHFIQKLKDCNKLTKKNKQYGIIGITDINMHQQVINHFIEKKGNYTKVIVF